MRGPWGRALLHPDLRVLGQPDRGALRSASRVRDRQQRLPGPPFAHEGDAAPTSPGATPTRRTPSSSLSSASAEPKSEVRPNGVGASRNDRRPDHPSARTFVVRALEGPDQPVEAQAARLAGEGPQPRDGGRRPQWPDRRRRTSASAEAEAPGRTRDRGRTRPSSTVTGQVSVSQLCCSGPMDGILGTHKLIAPTDESGEPEIGKPGSFQLSDLPVWKAMESIRDSRHIYTYRGFHINTSPRVIGRARSLARGCQKPHLDR